MRVPDLYVDNYIDILVPALLPTSGINRLLFRGRLYASRRYQLQQGPVEGTSSQ
jgi:hypothetical protein